MITPSKYIQNLIYTAMAARGIKTYAELSRRAGTYAQAVRGKLTKRHMTYADFVELADALGYEAHVSLTDKTTGETL